MKDYEVKIRATRDQIQDFANSILWKDIKRELGMWMRVFKKEREAIVDNAASTNPSTASVLLHLGDLNGRMKAVSYMLEIPSMFLSIMEAEKETMEKDTNLQED